MVDTCETVKVKNGDGFMVINKSDMTKDHVLFKKASKKETKKTDKKTKQWARKGYCYQLHPIKKGQLLEQ